MAAGESDNHPIDQPAAVQSAPAQKECAREATRREADILREVDSQIELLRAAASSPATSPADQKPATNLEYHALPSEPIRVGPCLVCGSTLATPRLAINPLQERFVTCDDCGLGSLFPMLSSQRIETLRSAFDSGVFCETDTHSWRLKLQRIRRLVRSLLRGLPERSQVLDVGRGSSSVQSAILELGHDLQCFTEGPGPGDSMNEGVRSRTDRSLSAADYDTGSFDAIVVWGTIESSSEPDRTIDEIGRLLRPGGRVIFALSDFTDWDARWENCRHRSLSFPEQLFHFSPVTLRRLLRNRGFVCNPTNRVLRGSRLAFPAPLSAVLDRLALSRQGATIAVTAEWKAGRSDSVPVAVERIRTAFAF